MRGGGNKSILIYTKNSMCKFEQYRAARELEAESIFFFNCKLEGFRILINF